MSVQIGDQEKNKNKNVHGKMQNSIEGVLGTIFKERRDPKSEGAAQSLDGGESLGSRSEQDGAKPIFAGRYMTTVVESNPLVIKKRFVRPKFADGNSTCGDLNFRSRAGIERIVKKLSGREQLSNLLVLITPTKHQKADFKMHCFAIDTRQHLGATSLVNEEVELIKKHQTKQSYQVMVSTHTFDLQDFARNSPLNKHIFSLVRNRAMGEGDGSMTSRPVSIKALREPKIPVRQLRPLLRHIKLLEAPAGSESDHTESPSLDITHESVKNRKTAKKNPKRLLMAKKKIDDSVKKEAMNLASVVLKNQKKKGPLRGETMLEREARKAKEAAERRIELLERKVQLKRMEEAAERRNREKRRLRNRISHQKTELEPRSPQPPATYPVGSKRLGERKSSKWSHGQPATKSSTKIGSKNERARWDRVVSEYSEQSSTKEPVAEENLLYQQPSDEWLGSLRNNHAERIEYFSNMLFTKPMMVNKYVQMSASNGFVVSSNFIHMNETDDMGISVLWTPKPLSESEGQVQISKMKSTICLPEDVLNSTLSIPLTLKCSRSFENLLAPARAPLEFSLRATFKLQQRLCNFHLKRAFTKFGALVNAINSRPKPRMRHLLAFFEFLEVMDCVVFVREEISYPGCAPIDYARFRLECFVFDDRKDFLCTVGMLAIQLHQFLQVKPHLMNNLTFVDDAFQLTAMPKILTNCLKTVLSAFNGKIIYNLLAELTYVWVQPPSSLLPSDDAIAEKKAERRRLYRHIQAITSS